MIDALQVFLGLAGSVLVVAIVNPLFLIPMTIVTVFFLFLRRFYLMTSINLKRMEATSKLRLLVVQMSVIHQVFHCSPIANLFSSGCLAQRTFNDKSF